MGAELYLLWAANGEGERAPADKNDVAVGEKDGTPNNSVESLFTRYGRTPQFPARVGTDATQRRT